MSTTEIIEELSKLSKDERHSIRVKLAEMDGGWNDEDDPLRESDKAIIESRLADLNKHPEKAIPWEKAKALLNSRFGS